MIALLPIACQYAKMPVSNFCVGAVVKGRAKVELNDDNSGYADLYLGANIEFENQALCHSIHAEQAAISIAWQAGENEISSIATSAVPCGHCRQFLYEISAGKALSILTPDSSSSTSLSYESKDISLVLPDAFGPADLNCKYLFMQTNPETDSSIFIEGKPDALEQQGILTANESYAPYTGNIAGCSVILKDGNIFSGRTIENAAFNPSLLAFSAVIIQLVMAHQSGYCIGKIFDSVVRVILVERPKKSSQKDLTKLLLAACRPDLELDYHAG